jgi:polyisoprenoid-binding protein YceI
MQQTSLLTALVLGTFIVLGSSTHAQSMTPLKDMPAGTYVTDNTHTSLVWSVSHMGLSNYTARFTNVSATLVFNPISPTASKLTASVDPLSVETDYPNPTQKDFDAKLAKDKDWLNGTQYPTITFTTTKLTQTGPNKGTMVGDLTFLGVTKPLTWDVTFNGAYAKQPISGKPALGFSAIAKMKRSEWGLATYVPMVGDDVTLRVETEFNQITPARPE